MRHPGLYIATVLVYLLFVVLFRLRTLRKITQSGGRVNYREAFELPLISWASTSLAAGLALAFPQYEWLALAILLVFVYALVLTLYVRKKRQSRARS
jgi:hypothetical protein